MSQQPEAQWFPDPERPGLRRWWDGDTWTEHRQEEEKPTLPPVVDLGAVRLVANILKGFAFLIIVVGFLGTIGGVIAAQQWGSLNDRNPAGPITGVVAGGVVGTLLLTSFFAFFGYVLDLLRGIYLERQ